MTKLGILIASARPNRVGEHVARWVHETLSAQFPDRMDVDLIDLREVALPAFDETTSPKQGQAKVTEHGKSWAERIGALDALIIVTPQYNGAYPGPLKTAIDWLYAEWSRLPTLLVGYSWGAASEVLPMLENLMARVEADVVGSLGLGFGEDLSVEGELFVAEEKAAALLEHLSALEQRMLSPVG